MGRGHNHVAETGVTLRPVPAGCQPLSLSSDTAWRARACSSAITILVFGHPYSTFCTSRLIRDTSEHNS